MQTWGGVVTVRIWLGELREHRRGFGGRALMDLAATEEELLASLRKPSLVQKGSSSTSWTVVAARMGQFAVNIGNAVIGCVLDFCAIVATAACYGEAARPR